MFESIQGRLVGKDPGRVVVETGGIGYLLQVPLSEHDRLPALGDEVRLLVHLEVREDAWRLYGFARADVREAFRRLLRVTGVGPTTAVGVLSALDVRTLAAAVASGDAASLARVKGVGRKTAERIVAELKDDVKKGLLGDLDGRGTAPAGSEADVLRALAALGLDALEARRKLDAARRVLPPDAPVEAVVRQALRA